jgi:hypothetical protein
VSPGHGGPRPGSGQPPVAGQPQSERVNLRLTEAELAEISAAIPEDEAMGRWIVGAALSRARARDERARPFISVGCTAMTDTLAAATGRFVIYVITDGAAQPSDVHRVLPMLTVDQVAELWHEGRAWLSYATEREVLEAFNQIPEESETPFSLYAYLAGPQGGITENT